MPNNNTLLLGAVAIGATALVWFALKDKDAPPFKPGDRVRLLNHPEQGLGTVITVTDDGENWWVTLQWDILLIVQTLPAAWLAKV